MTVGNAAGPLNNTSCYGSLTIDDISMHTPAWHIPDLSQLWSTPPLRGANRLIPGRQGRKPYKRRKDEAQYTLPILITGYCDSYGVPYTNLGIDWMQGLEANVAFLQNNVAFPPNNADSTRLATFVLPSGNARRSLVQVISLRGQLNPGGIMQATLDLIDTEGNLAVGGQEFVDA